MTERTLYEALRTDVRGKFALIRSLYALRQASTFATNAVNQLAESIQARDEGGQDPERDRLVIGDLLTVETLLQDLAERIDAHKRAIEVGLFGTSRTEDNA